MVTRMYQHKKVCTWIHRTCSFFVSTNKSFSQIHGPFNKSARQPHRPRRRRIDRPALQPLRCRAGAYVYEYNVSLSGKPPPSLTGWRRYSPRNTMLTGYGENSEPTARAPLDTSTTAGLYIFPPPVGAHPATVRRRYSLFAYTLGDARHIFLPRSQFPSLHGRQTLHPRPRTKVFPFTFIEGNKMMMIFKQQQKLRTLNIVVWTGDGESRGTYKPTVLNR